ncbi:hypothetical protein [Gloeobacter morelensis]|uniref:hypothetical protein n=1 Tax=Gloeobacter morelensis TaxID=2907343 RepID=UPI001E406FAE|nr:hypothetical protein [Gloeobacter morelensis]UFP97278.1 hypothetical protein ISF26_24460 [Gloeobacter morelensis MG652769]
MPRYRISNRVQSAYPAPGPRFHELGFVEAPDAGAAIRQFKAASRGEWTDLDKGLTAHLLKDGR